MKPLDSTPHRARLELVMTQAQILTTPDRGVVELHKLPLSRRPHYVRLVAANGQILAVSESYATKAAAKRGAAAWMDAIMDIAGCTHRHEGHQPAGSIIASDITRSGGQP